MHKFLSKTGIIVYIKILANTISCSSFYFILLLVVAQEKNGGAVFKNKE